MLLQVTMTVYKLSEYNFCKNGSEFYDKMDLPIQIRIFYMLKIVMQFTRNLKTYLKLF